MIFAGISLEVVAAFPAITARRGLEGARGGRRCVRTFSQTKREACFCAATRRCDPFRLRHAEGWKFSKTRHGRRRAVYGALDMPWAKIVGQVEQDYGR